MKRASKDNDGSSAKTSAIKLLIADGHKMFREGLVCMLASRTDIRIVGEAQSVLVAVELAARLSPDVVLLDIPLLDFSGIEATRKIIETVPTAGIIALSIHEGREYIQEIIKCGASGYLVKECGFKELLQAIHAVHQGKSYLCSSVAKIVIESYVAGNSHSSTSSLTDREREVLQCIANGLSTKKTAAELKINTKTVETHRRQIMRKLGLFNVAQLTKFAIREGLASLQV